MLRSGAPCAAADCLSASVSVCRALGGAWVLIVSQQINNPRLTVAPFPKEKGSETERKALGVWPETSHCFVSFQ